MATPTPAQQAQNIRDNLLAEFNNETARRLSFTAAGKPPPATYSVGGRSVPWNEYVRTMQGLIKDATELAVLMGADGGLYEIVARGYT